MARHPDFYTDLLRRRFAPGQSLTAEERQELDLHLLICPQCNFDYAQLLFAEASRQPEAHSQLQAVELDANIVIPYLRDLVRARHAGQPLTPFQRLVWEFVCRDPTALGYYRLIEADWLLQHVQ